MIRVLSSIIVLISLIMLLILPILLGLIHTSMSHHDMDISSCLEHCLGNEKNSNFQELTNNIRYSIKIIINQIIQNIFELGFFVVLFFIIYLYIPPNFKQTLKNCSYSYLVGIIKLTT